MPLGSDVRQLGVTALAIVSLAVIVGVGAIVLTELQPVSHLTSDTQSEVAQPATPFPTNYTVDAASSDSDFVRITDGSTSVIFEDTSAATNITLTVDTDYLVFADSGNLEFQNTSATSDYNESEDNLYVDYQYQYSGSATSVLATGINSLQTFADFFTVIVVIAIAAVLFLMLRVVRSAGRSVGA